MEMRLTLETLPPVRALAVSESSLLRANAGTFEDEKSVMFDMCGSLFNFTKFIKSFVVIWIAFFKDNGNDFAS